MSSLRSWVCFLACCAPLLACGCTTSSRVCPPTSEVPATPAGAAPEPIQQASATSPASLQAAGLAQALAVARDEQATLLSKVQQLQAALDEKEQLLTRARDEIRGATEDISRARAELAHCRNEVTALRVRLISAEKENLNTLQTITSILEKAREQK